MRLPASLLLLAALLAGCPLAAPPALDLPPRATATPWAPALGAIRGRVFGAGGPTQAIGLAQVAIGAASTFTANPKEGEEVAEDDAVKDADFLTVLHAFTPGGTPVLATRRIRKAPWDPAERYVYLRLGEFFLEGIPEGSAAVVASFGNVSSTPAPLTVYKNTIVEDVALTLLIPEPLRVSVEPQVPRIVEAANVMPAGRLTLTGAAPGVTMTLRAPPGSPGTVVAAYNLRYQYTPPGQPLKTVSAHEVPIPAVAVPPTDEITFGPKVTINVPLGSPALDDLRRLAKAERPVEVTALIGFLDEQNVPVPDRSLNALEVAVRLRLD